MCRNTFGKCHRSDKGSFNFFQTIPTHFDFFIINRVVDFSRTMQAE